MMGNTHAATGAVAGVLLAWAVHAGPASIVVAGLLSAGAALVPDLDHTNSIVTRAHGPITRGLSDFVRWLSMVTYKGTRTPWEASHEGGKHSVGKHRYLTHTMIFAIAMGLIVLAASIYPLTFLPIVFLMVSFALRGAALGLASAKDLDAWPVRSLVAVIISSVIVWHSSITGTEVAAYMILGCLTHDLADGMTKAGVPLLWPIKIRGQRWCRVRTPITATTGEGWFEPILRWICLVAAPILTLMAWAQGY